MVMPQCFEIWMEENVLFKAVAGMGEYYRGSNRSAKQGSGRREKGSRSPSAQSRLISLKLGILVVDAPPGVDPRAVAFVAEKVDRESDGDIASDGGVERKDQSPRRH
jgi:hypothetical protein